VETEQAAEVVEQSAAREEHSPPHSATLREYAESILVTILLALFATSFVVQSFKIPTPSMEKTLLVGDHLFVNKFIFGGRGQWYDHLLPYRDIRRGDIIVFKFPFQDHPHYVKRVIGIPGDRIRIVDEQVYVNGRPLNEAYVERDPTAGYDPFSDNFPPRGPEDLSPQMQPEWSEVIFQYVHNGELVVPPNKFFAMGDNRDRSWDSRFWGFVDREAIMGRPLVIYWSVQSDSDEDESAESFSQRAREIFGTLIHLGSRTRWSRMFREVH